MTPEGLFGVVVRSVGLLLLLASLYYLAVGAYLALAASAVAGFASFAMLVQGVPCLLVSLYLLRGAPDLVRFCYPGTPSASASPANRP